MKAPTTPEGRGSKLKQAQLPFARTPPVPHPRPAEAPSSAPPAKKPRLDEAPSPPAPSGSFPVLVDDDSVESITCEPTICPKDDESPSSSEEKVETEPCTDPGRPDDPDSTLNESGLSTSDTESELDKSALPPEGVDSPSDTLTPNKISKKLEWAKKREERERNRRLRELQRLAIKAAKSREKEEKEQRKIQREIERKEREEAKKKEQEERERSRKERQEFKEQTKEKKLREIESKNKKAEEEKQRREQEKQRKEEEKEKVENKKKKAAAAFISFFVPKTLNKNEASKENATENTPHTHKFLSNFTIKSDMRLAPIVRHKIGDESKEILDKLLLDQSIEKNLLYLSVVKTDRSLPKTSGKTWPLEDLKDDLIVVEDDLPPVDETKEDKMVIDKKNNPLMRAKLFSFHENRRPPYWGTHQRKSKKISGRKPFATDTALLDYDCDSDEEWEEEEPGESVESIAGSDDEEGDNEYDVDNDFMVPHGYLSDEEALGEDENALTPEALKAKLQFLEHEFEDEMKKPTKIKKPRLIGIVWQNSEGKKPDTCHDAVWNFLMSKSMITSESEIIIHSSDLNMESNIEDGEKSASKKSRKFPDEMIPDLIKLVHGNTNNRGFLVKEFQKFISNKNGISSNSESILTIEEKSNVKELSNVSVARKIKELSTWMPCPEQGAMYSRMCWFVEKEVREKFNITNLQLPNDWSYLLVPRKRTDSSKKEKPITENSTLNKESPPKKESSFNIKKFTKTLTQEERHKQFTPQMTVNPSDEKTDDIKNKQVHAPIVEKKRVSLQFLGPRDNKNTNSPSQNTCSELESVPNTAVSTKSDTTNSSNVKKRVALLSSVPLTNTTKPCRANLLTQFIKTAKDKYGKSSDEMDVDDCIILSE